MISDFPVFLTQNNNTRWYWTV